MIIGHDGAGAMDEFGPDSMWAYIYDNPQDDEWAEELMGGLDDDDGVEGEVMKRACNRCDYRRSPRVTMCPRCGSPEFRIVKERKK